ncbi:MAG TPA: ABC transporter permease [Myxococcota bacterium]|nr:ABC transporter permease [Myxococcota bacterium]
MATPLAESLRRDDAAPLPGRLLHLHELTLHLVARDLASRQRGSLLGWLWSLAPPLLQLVLVHFLFTRVVPLGVENYALFLLTGILAWSGFSRGLAAATDSLEANRSLVLRPGFPTPLLPLVAVLVAFVDQCLALPILLVAVAATSGLAPAVALLPALLAIQLALTTGLAWCLAPLQVFLRDTRHLVGIALSLGFWITPIFYAPRRLPDALGFLHDANPMAQLIAAQRAILLHGTLPDAAPLALVAGLSLVLLVAGFAVFHATQHALAERV